MKTQSQEIEKHSCDLSPLRKMFLENETTPSDCAKSITNLIEFTSLLYMVALHEKETKEHLVEMVYAKQSEGVYFLNEIGVGLSKLNEITETSDLYEIEKLIYDSDPNNLSDYFNEISIGINRLLNYIITNSEEGIDKLNSLMKYEYYDSVVMINKLSFILAEIAKLNKHLYD